MKIQHAVITAAGRGQRALPLQKLVDRDGAAKTAIRILAEEVRSAGIESLTVVVRPGDEDAFAEAIGDAVPRLRFVAQPQPLGYGHAVFCARDPVGGEPFLHLVSDHLYVGADGQSCARRLVELAEAEGVAVSAVQPTRETVLGLYGTVGGRRVKGRAGLYEVQKVVEKPTPTEAEQDLIVPGLRAGHYLCFFGMHVLTPAVMDLLAEEIEAHGATAGAHLSRALSALTERERYLAWQSAGQRYNIGEKYGLFTAQMALALSGVDRELVLTQMLELLAQRELGDA